MYVTAAVENYLPPNKQYPSSLLEKPSIKRTLNNLKDDLVITVTDKADKNFSLICKHYYKEVLHRELHDPDGAYETVDLPSEAILQNFTNELAGVKCPAQVKKLDDVLRPNRSPLALLYWIPKQHKDPPKARFIAASTAVMTKPLAVALNTILGAIKLELRRRDERHWRETSVRRCWFVNGFHEVTSRLRVSDRPRDTRLHCLNTFDFETMYTTLDQDYIIGSHTFAIQEAFGDPDHPPYYTHLYYTGPTKKMKWVSASEPVNPDLSPEHLYTADDLIKLVRILVKNIYIQNGDLIRRQRTGLPMGTNPAPHMADLTCYRPEAQAMDRLQQQDINSARSFATTCRYIDDIISADNPSFADHVMLTNATAAGRDIADPIYPPFLLLKQTNTSSTQADYVGMTIESAPRSFLFTVNNNSARLPVPKINYPDLQGNFPTVAGYGVLTGQLHRFARISTRATDFVDQCVILCRTLLSKGFVHSRMKKTIYAFLEHHNPYRTTPHIIFRMFCSRLL
jgi:hypothetical protein